MEELACQELVELVTDYFEDALTPAERARVDAHLADCPGCANYFEQVRATVTLTGGIAALERGPELAGLLEAFRGFKRLP